MKKKVLSMLAVLSMIFAMIGTVEMVVSAAETVTYIDKYGDTQTTAATAVTSGDTQWSGTYIVNGEISMDNRVKINGNVSLILADGAKLTAHQGIQVGASNTFTVYGQSGGTGVLNAFSKNFDAPTSLGGYNKMAAIGGNEEENCGTVAICGGIINTVNEGYGAGIGGGYKGGAGTIEIYRGKVVVNSGINTGGITGMNAYGAGIGGGDQGHGGYILIAGGDISCQGKTNGGCIGNGRWGSGGKVQINRGNINVSNAAFGSGIGGGYSTGVTGESLIEGRSVLVQIWGGTVTASADCGAGIGSGCRAATSLIEVHGGNVTATSNTGAGIGSGELATDSLIKIDGGNVTASSKTGAGIGSGESVQEGLYAGVELEGGMVTASSAEGDGIGSGLNSVAAVVALKGDTAVIASSVTYDSYLNFFQQGILIDLKEQNGRVYGNTLLQDNFTVPQGIFFTIPESSTLTIRKGVTLTNQGNLIKDGTLIMNGIYDGPKPIFYYCDDDGNWKFANVDFVTADDTVWKSGWYAVRKEITIDHNIALEGDVCLILEDGGKLTVNGKIGINDGDDWSGSLTVYGQRKGTGKLQVDGGETYGIEKQTVRVVGAEVSSSGAGTAFECSDLHVVNGTVRAVARERAGYKIGIADTLHMQGSALVVTNGVRHFWGGNGILFDNSVGTVYGEPAFYRDIEIPQDTALTIPEDAVLTVMPSAVLTNNGALVNSGELTVYGEFKNNSNFSGNAVTGIRRGEYIQMGNYDGAPILWRCVAADEKNGGLMLSDKIISLKAFDAKTDGRWSDTESSSHHIKQGDGTDDRRAYGSNYWADSNLRSWLNSNAHQVDWICGNPPSRANTTANAYDAEAGFLTNFTQRELNVVRKVTLPSILSVGDQSEKDAGGELYSFSGFGTLTEGTGNSATAYTKKVTDKMFLPDIGQMNEVFGAFGEAYCMGYPTEGMVKDGGFPAGTPVNYWLRTPEAQGIDAELYVSSDGTVNNAKAYEGAYGVRPAFYFNQLTSRILYGSGTESDPYVVFALSGEGTEASPYLIEDVNEFEYFYQAVRHGEEFNGEYFRLTADIDLSKICGNNISGAQVCFEPVGGNFKGNFDGGGHQISSLSISDDKSTQNRGLFACVNENSAVKNLGVACTISANNFVGGIAGQNNGVIENCYTLGTVTGQFAVGGIVGQNNGIIKNCYTTAAISATAMVGAVTGAGTGTVNGCYYDKEAYTGEPGTGVIGAVPAQFHSGEIAWRLQKSAEDQSIQSWGQNLSGADSLPVPTGDGAKRVFKAAFIADGQQITAQYANPGGMFTLPADEPVSEFFTFTHWSASGTDLTENAKYMGTENVTEDITVYAAGEKKYGESKEAHTVIAVGGTERTVDLSKYVGFADGSPTDGAFAYTIINGNDDLCASISDQIMRIPQTAPFGTYELKIVVKSKQPHLSLMSINAMDTREFSFDLTVMVLEENQADETFPVTVSEDTEAILYEASYDAGRRLVYLKMTEISLEAGTTDIDISQSIADEFMIWDKNMRPLAGKYVPQEVE